jgi:cytochrome c
VPGFAYSAANRQSGLTWDPATLDRYLTSPRQVVPGTLMTFAGLHDPAQRAAVIAYLATLH